MHKTTKVLMVVLRIAIGWHFLYEGVFKIESYNGGQQYLTSRYYLQTSTAKLRDFFEQQAPGALTIEAAGARIDLWYDEILKHYKGQNNELTRPQQKDLAATADELKSRAAGSIRNGADLSGVAAFDWYQIHNQVLKVEDKPGEHFTALAYLQGATGPFRGLFRSFVPDLEGLDRLSAGSAQARLDARFDELVAHYGTFTSEQQAKLARERDNLSVAVAGAIQDPGFQARLADYRFMLARVRDYERDARQPFSRERLEAYRKRLDLVAGEMLAVVNEPLVELTRQAQGIATVQQMEAGPAPRPREQTWLIDFLVSWGLTAMGVCLITGLFSRYAAAAAACQMAMFYFAAPPLPGLPAATLGGHYMYVDRNLIELIAAALLATVPSGMWAGLDALLAAFVWPRLRRREAPPQPQPEEQPAPAHA